MQCIHFETGEGVSSVFQNTPCMYCKTLYVTCSVYTLRQVKGYQVSCLTLSVCIVKLLYCMQRKHFERGGGVFDFLLNSRCMQSFMLHAAYTP